MARLIVVNRRLAYSGRQLVTSAGGAGCCCGGCFDEFPTPECVTLTLELLDLAECEPGMLIKFGDPPPSGAFQLESLGDNQTYALTGTDISTTVFDCGTNEPVGSVADYAYSAVIKCDPDAWDGATRYGIELIRIGAFAVWSGAWGLIDWLYEPLCNDGPWLNEQRPGATVLMEGETAVNTLTLGGCARPVAQYRLSWTRTECVDAPVTGACCQPDGSCSDLTAEDCALAGGEFKGDGTECAGRNCPTESDEGACCLRTGECVFGTRGECDALGGKFTRGIGCAKVACIPFEPREGEAACCLPSGLCVHATTAECGIRGGQIIGPQCVSLYCDSNPPQLTAGDFF